ncbi:methyl-accepting chemotaxis protein [Pseudomonas cichorii]|uniref:Methyl-accepting chemotaxis protein n=2 Tax=Pseudomonas syringae group TaxID=136849 RepID=A0ABX8HTN0_9PSED|nr:MULTISPECIES: methyl-accepting chemotaxis protein [Pseudomonas syringae group]MBX8492638.1 methyl-accepting chemotaxis protein [Pseudomonas cichorii]MBX8502219.1 methyl-accepting chemotaxis protein [Pseudomonas lijiangensis]MBX8507054.1 methyl-accepting chemotaxis protein [Pseudomonas lijiangensis]MBX8511983.1 methyl-accepting chemotaxis protein [Pseudomonas cichorii]MBX8521864.1 methyl-accepting chemotaxis protein [Pseudomonas cichorii]
MSGLLSPGMRLMGHFGFARKFQVLFLLFMLPLVGSVWMIAQDYRNKLAVITGEQSGVRQLLVLDDLDFELSTQRDNAARWKAADILREPTPAAKAAIAKLDANVSKISQALDAVGAKLAQEDATAETMERYRALQASVKGLDSASLRTVGWWPDGYDRFTASLSLTQALREQIAMDSGLILDPWLETYMLMQLSTQQMPDLIERIGRMASIGQTSVATGQFSLQSRLQMRDLRGRIDDAKDQMHKAGNLLLSKLPPELEPWAVKYKATSAMLDAELKVLDEGVFGGSIKLKPEEFERSIDALLGGMAQLRKQSLVSLNDRLEYYRDTSNMQFIPMAVAFGVLLLAALYLFVCLQSSIRRSASGITTLAESLRDGNLCVEVSVQGRDELAAISKALNVAVVQLRTSLLGVNHETRQLGDAVLTLNTQSNGTLSEVEEQQYQISQIAAAATELAATSQGVARSCEQASDSARQTRKIAEESSRDSRRTTDSIQQLNQRLTDTAAALGRVSEQGQQIQSVVDAIRGIAEQTNLLALNAAIEAARAGEQGRGFAVVADEVRSLSQRTQASTAEIAGTVDSLRSTVTQAVNLMEAACGQAVNDAQSVTGLGLRLGEIASAVQGVTDTLVQISTAVEEQASTADEVSNNIQQVDQAAGRLLEGARAVNQAADTLSKGSRALNDNTARFQLG